MQTFARLKVYVCSTQLLLLWDFTWAGDQVVREVLYCASKVRLRLVIHASSTLALVPFVPRAFRNLVLDVENAVQLFKLRFVKPLFVVVGSEVFAVGKHRKVHAGVERLLPGISRGVNFAYQTSGLEFCVDGNFAATEEVLFRVGSLARCTSSASSTQTAGMASRRESAVLEISLSCVKRTRNAVSRAQTADKFFPLLLLSLH